jgi:hypothetical protein
LLHFLLDMGAKCAVSPCLFHHLWDEIALDTYLSDTKTHLLGLLWRFSECMESTWKAGRWKKYDASLYLSWLAITGHIEPPALPLHELTSGGHRKLLLQSHYPVLGTWLQICDTRPGSGYTFGNEWTLTSSSFCQLASHLEVMQIEFHLSKHSLCISYIPLCWPMVCWENMWAKFSRAYKRDSEHGSHQVDLVAAGVSWHG